MMIYFVVRLLLLANATTAWQLNWVWSKPLTSIAYCTKPTHGYGGGGPTATVDNGILKGTTTSLAAATASINKFLGVPFAAVPKRFEPPQRAPSSHAVIDATGYSASCIQQFNSNFSESIFNQPPPRESEDCLYLNVYAPSTPAPADGRAVLFWIYGGSLQFGYSGLPYYDGSSFASYEDVIVVTTNYRTNVFGFPSSPEIPIGGNNLGFLDQREALQWTQRNIAAFGGSPSKVTVFGESAGAFSVDALLTSFPKGSTPPFRAAILESGQYSYGQVRNVSASRTAWQALSSALGCPSAESGSLECVKRADASRIKAVEQQLALSFRPIPDNITLVSNPAKQRLSGNIARIPVMGGTNSQEGRVFTVAVNDTTAFLISTFGNNTELISAIEAAYPASDSGLATDYDRASAILTDFFFQCTQAKWANDTASLQIPTWRYYFNASFINTQVFPNLGVFHSSEIPIVFGTYPLENATTQEYALSQTMQRAWAAFAKDPERGPGWNQVGTGATGLVAGGEMYGSAGVFTANELVSGGVLRDGNGEVISGGSFDLAVLGNRLDVPSAGVTVIAQAEVDSRCAVWEPVYKALLESE